ARVLAGWVWPAPGPAEALGERPYGFPGAAQVRHHHRARAERPAGWLKPAGRLSAPDVDDRQDGAAVLEDLVQGDELHAREIGGVVEGSGLVDGVFDDGVNPSQGGRQVEQAIEHLLGAAKGRMADQDGHEDELAEAGVGDGEVEEGLGVGAVLGLESAVEGGDGFVSLLVDELAADVVLVGQAGDAAALVEGIQREADALLSGHGERGTGGLGARDGYNAHGLASGSSRAVLIPSIYRRQAFSPLPRLLFVTRL